MKKPVGLPSGETLNLQVNVFHRRLGEKFVEGFHDSDVPHTSVCTHRDGPINLTLTASGYGGEGWYSLPRIFKLPLGIRGRYRSDGVAHATAFASRHAFLRL